MLLCLDVETLTKCKGNPYSIGGGLVSIHGAYYDKEQLVAQSFKPDDPQVQTILNKATCLIGFNLKFDLAWLRKAKLVFPQKVYDVQLAHFYITNQQHKLPSLNEVAEYYNIAGKLDVVKEQYWDKGLDTDQVPWPILCEYGEQDVKLTYQLYLRQQEHWQQFPKKHTLFKLACQDLLVLQEMEWNGLYYDEETCYKKSSLLQEDIGKILKQLNNIYPGVSINFNSPHQLSAFLYGGVIKEDGKELCGFYKTGQKAGQPKYKNVIKEHTLPRLFKPLPKSEMAAPGVFSTDEGTLRSLKGKNKPYLDLLLELAKLTKLDETYYQGLTKLNVKMSWPKNYLHGQFNQCIAKTGRLSSSAPNLQNLSGDSLDIFKTRYD